MVLALEGVRVLELVRVAPGAFCTRLLGDLGAEVVKVEDPQTASAVRGREALLRRSNLDRGKQSMVLDLKKPEAQEVLHRLAKRADVVVEGFRPGVAGRLGADYPTLSALNPRLIYCSLSGYGQEGPYRDMPGHDINYLSIAGALDIIGERGGRPVIPLNILADYASASLHGVIGILVALLVRERTGRGQYIDVSYTDGVLSLLGAVPTLWGVLLGGRNPRRGESSLGGAYPYYNVYETKDGGYISLGCIEHHFWENLCRALGREDLLPYRASPAHSAVPPEDGGWERALQELRAIFRTRTRREWFEFLRQYDICVAPVQTFAEALEDPQVRHRGMVVEVENPHLGRARLLNFPIRFSQARSQVKGLAPRPGEQTRPLLHSLGYSPEEVRALEGAGAAVAAEG